jgi:hypothetical protein
VSVPDESRFTGICQLIGRVLSNSLQHAVADLGRAWWLLGDDQRLVDELIENIKHGAPVDAPRSRGISTHTLRGFQRKSAGEHCQTPQEHARSVVEQVMTPVHGRAECLVPRIGRTPGRQELESLMKPTIDLLWGKHAEPCRGEFDGERHAIELSADLCHGSCTGFGQYEVWDQGTRAFDEEADGLAPLEVCSQGPGRVVGQGQRRYSPHDFPLQAQRAATCREDLNARARAQYDMRERCAGAMQVLTVIKDEKFGSSFKELCESIDGSLTSPGVDSQFHGHNLRHQVRVAETSKFDERDADNTFSQNSARNRQCQTGLTAPARADQRQQPTPAQTAD